MVGEAVFGSCGGSVVFVYEVYGAGGSGCSECADDVCVSGIVVLCGGSAANADAGVSGEEVNGAEKAELSVSYYAAKDAIIGAVVKVAL